MALAFLVAEACLCNLVQWPQPVGSDLLNVDQLRMDLFLIRDIAQFSGVYMQ